MDRIFSIPSVYFDTNHVIEIVRLRHQESRTPEQRRIAYQAISIAVLKGEIKVLFNPAITLEWIEGAKSTRQWEEISEFFETAKLIGEIDVNFVFLIELIEETRRHYPPLQLPTIQLIREIREIPRSLVELFAHHPQWQHLQNIEPRKCPGAAIGIRQWVADTLSFSGRKPDAIRERITGWEDAILETRKSFLRHRARGISQTAKMEWANRSLHLDKVVKSSNPELDLIWLASQIDFDRLPACSLYLNALWRYAKGMTDKGPKENDGDDWAQIPLIAYADFSLVERPLRKHLLAGTPLIENRLFNEPSDLVSKLRC